MPTAKSKRSSDARARIRWPWAVLGTCLVALGIGLAIAAVIFERDFRIKRETGTLFNYDPIVFGGICFGSTAFIVGIVGVLIGLLGRCYRVVGIGFGILLLFLFWSLVYSFWPTRETLVTAARTGNPVMARWSLLAGFSPNALDHRPTVPNGRQPWHSALNVAIESRHFDIAKLLIEYGADVNMKDAARYYPIVCAVYTGNRDLVQYLVEKGANSKVHIGFPKGNLAHATSNPELLDDLRKLGVGLDEPDSEGNTPLIKNARYGRWETVGFLLKHGANPHHANDKKKTALRYAEESWKDLKSGQASPNYKSTPENEHHSDRLSKTLKLLEPFR